MEGSHPSSSVDAQAPTHTLHEWQSMLVVQHQFRQWVVPCSQQVKSPEWMNTRQHHPEEHPGAKTKVIEKNAYENSKYSQPNMHKNWVKWCWKSVKDEQVREHALQHHLAVVELLIKRKEDSQLRWCLHPHEMAQHHQWRMLSEAWFQTFYWDGKIS